MPLARCKVFAFGELTLVSILRPVGAVEEWMGVKRLPRGEGGVGHAPWEWNSLEQFVTRVNFRCCWVVAGSYCREGT